MFLPQCCKQDEVKKALPIMGSVPLHSAQWDQVCLEEGACRWAENECQVPKLVHLESNTQSLGHHAGPAA